MKRLNYTSVLVLILLGYLQLPGQDNLVLNPSFEAYSECPDNLYQIDRILFWSSASPFSSSALNSCSIVRRAQVPFGGFYFDSYQLPRTGSGLAHLIVYSDLDIVGQPYTNIAYLQGQLKTQLEANTTYYVEWFVSPDISARPWANATYIKSFGAAFSSKEYYETPPRLAPLSIRPAVQYTGDFITDTLGWTRVSGCFTADGTENYIVIGNFDGSGNTAIQATTTDVYPILSEYYVDDVGLFKFNPLPDTLILCSGQESVIDSKFLTANYLWNNGSTESQITVTEAGAYTVEVKMGDCILRDTTTVIFIDDQQQLNIDTTFCYGEPLMLSPLIPGNYVWDDGSTQQSLLVSTPGQYRSVINNECGEYTYEATVTGQSCDCSVYVPNAFSPNNDGNNDLFEVYYNCIQQTAGSLALEIYDRWGNLLHSSDREGTVNWDGTSNAQALTPGVYLWKITYVSSPETHVSSTITGTVNLLR